MKLFNKQRFQLLKGQRLQKYLLYAIGEIILVVIGILVAVAINNFNEEQQSEQEIREIALQIQSKMKTDLASVKLMKNVIAEETDLYNRYLKKDKTESEKMEILVQAPFMVTLYVEFLPVNPIMSSVLEKASASNTDLAKKLLEIEQDYQLAERSLRPMEEIIKDELVSNITYIKDNFDWYEKLVGDKPNFTVDEYQYFFSTDYRNRVVHMRFLYTDGYASIIDDLEIILNNRLEELNALL
jgi:hypothetical protein